MKIYFLIIFFVICSNMFSQESNLYSIKIDSVNTIISEIDEDMSVLEVYVSINNLSSETISIVSPGSLHNRQLTQGWNLIITKNGKAVEWGKALILDYAQYKEIKIKKDKTANIRFVSTISDMFTDESGLNGDYTATVELTNLETKKVKKQTILSNTVDFQIKTPITK